MKKKLVKFKPLQELYDYGDTLLNNPKAGGLFKDSLKTSTTNQASVVDVYWDRNVKCHKQLLNSVASSVPSISCQSSFSEDIQSLDSLKAPGSSEVLPMFQHVTASQTTVEHQDQNVFDCQGDDYSCISKDDGAVMISSDPFVGADHKIVTSSAASVSSSCPDLVEKSLDGPPARNGSPIASTQDSHLHNQNVTHGDGSDELVDVRICDICGDLGREALLALCSKCSDGAEHIYCMSPKMDKVPEGDWFCEECMLMQDPKRHRQVMVERSDNTSKPSCSKELSQVSPTIKSAVLHDDEMTKNHPSKASCLSNKRLRSAVDVRSETKKGIADRSDHSLKISGLGEKSQLTQVSSLKNMNKGKNAARQVSSFVDLPAKKMVKQACSSDHRLPKSKQPCGGSFNNNSRVEVQRSKEDIHQRRRSAKDYADCKLKKDHPDKEGFKSVSLTGASSILPETSNTQSSVLTLKGVRNGSRSNFSVENKTNHVGLPPAGSSPRKVSSSRTKLVPKPVTATHSPRKNVADKTSIQVNGNTNVKALDCLVHEGKTCANTSAGSVVERNPSYVVNSPAKDVNAYPDQRASLYTQKTEFDKTTRDDNDHSVASYKVLPFDFQDIKATPLLDPVDFDHLALSLTSAVPESRCIWKGSFKLEKSGKLPTDCYGVQAHLSTRASSKVAELVFKFPNELLLKEVPRPHIWPIQFQKNYPTEQDIAFYFFAQDLWSYGKSYSMLLEGMTDNDLALEANFDGFQLLIFPSSLLPVRSQCWNSMLFLWGVFRVRRIDDYQLPSLNVAFVNQGSYSPVTCGSEGQYVSSPVSASAFESFTPNNSMLEPESVLQSSALTKSGNQSIEHEVPALKKHIGTLKIHDVQADIITFACDWRKGNSGGGLHSDDLQKENGFSDEDIESGSKTDIVRCGQSTRELTTVFGLRSDGSYKGPSFTQVNDSSEFWLQNNVVVGSSFSLDSGPSGSSDGGGCAKSADEPQVELSENPRSYNALNLELCLGNSSGSEEVDLDLVLGFPSKSEYQPKDSLKDGINQDKNVSVLLSLGMPCSTS